MIQKTAALCLLVCSLIASAGCSPASDPDQKWLTTVQKLVLDGNTRISTTSRKQAYLLTKWAAKQGFAVGVKKSGSGYQIDLISKVPPKPAPTNAQPGVVKAAPTNVQPGAVKAAVPAARK